MVFRQALCHAPAFRPSGSASAFTATYADEPACSSGPVCGTAAPATMAEGLPIG